MIPKRTREIEKFTPQNSYHQQKRLRIMKIIAINAGPRKKWNTATLLEQTLAGAASQGAETELIHLYDLNFKGCISCLACKTVNGKSEGRCAMRDDLTPVLDKIEEQADALVVGSPIYLASVTGEARSFMERLLFAPMVYTKPPSSRFPKKLNTALIYTMNLSEQGSIERQYPVQFQIIEDYFARILGSAETFCAYDTCQVDDFSKMVMEYADPVYKKQRKAEAFPEDCRRAYQLGIKLAQAS